ncbi:PIF1-like helicase [Medicago truncatula]|uniref:ATP-dependent DNA helicase n=1 Tax=Medicago truncatula TaxID=3880 RepID=G7JPZ9_MEDTR|nr:PIF1-like helicase [Medicago truncatula]
MLQSSGKSLKDYPPMPRADRALVPDVQDVLINEELNYDRKALGKEHERLMSSMTSEQRNVYDTIMTRVSQNKPGVFFLYGYGGIGKTFLWRAMGAALRSQGEIIIIVNSSGIAALLIHGGRTAHSRFGIPILIHEASTCPIDSDSPLAKLIIKAKLIIWDEAPMMHRYCFEAVDRSFRDVMRDVDKRFKHIPFGGKVVFG